MKKQIIKIIKEAGKLAIDYQSKINISTKEDSTIVTEGDIAVSNFLIEKLSKFYPVLSEENYDESLLNQSDTFFVIDPIDGTVSYSKKEDTWCTIVALVKNNEPIMSFVYQATKDKMFIAEKGKGTFLINNGKKIKQSVSSELKTIIVSPNYKEEDLKLIPNYDKLKLIKEYGAALKIMNIVERNADIYPIENRWFGVWDLIGSSLILKEAGGHFKFLDDYKFDLKEKKLNHPFIASSIKISLK